jgi:ATP-dependent helicase HrpB
VEKSLPIWGVAPGIIDALRGGNRLVLAAPTGSGKSTQVPAMLIDSLGLRKIVVLQPRRVAARTLAARVAHERNSKLGQEVGYQVRFEDHTSRGTRISFVTEGILLRWLQDDPELRGFDAVVFDEFHERNLLSDVSLALVKALQKQARPELKAVVMSATLDTASVAKYLGDCPVISSEGTMFAVEVNYQPFGEREPMSRQAAAAVEHIINSGEEGDILIFMPGMSEIQATIMECRGLGTIERFTLIPLHGELPPEEQDRAFEEHPRRKVIVSTNVAETSVTIPGIRHVIDSGVARVARYDAERGLGTLLIEEISRASADQRKGRAGRTAPGTCRRLWTESNHLNRPERNTPEIQRADLAEVVLLLHSLGIQRAAEFDWLDRPDPAAVTRAEKLLETLGAIDATGLTKAGRKMLRLPMHPRYSRMLVEASRFGCVKEAALCAALLSGRDMLTRPGRDDKHVANAREDFEGNDQSDFFVLIEAFNYARQCGFEIEACRRRGVHAQAARQVAMTWAQILDIARSQGLENSPLPEGGEGGNRYVAESLQRCILAGFVDQLCLRKDQGTLDCLLTEGRAGTLIRESVVQKSPLMVVASIREVSGKQGHLTLLGVATAVRIEWLRESFPEQFSDEVEYLYDRTHKRVAALRFTRFRDLTIGQQHEKELDAERCGEALAAAYLEGIFELPLFTHDLKQFIARVNFVAKTAPELDFPAYDREALRRALAKAFRGLTLAKEAQAVPLRGAILSHLAKEQVQWLDEIAPQSMGVLEGRKSKLLYTEDGTAELQLKLSECFDLREHPRICEGKAPVVLWLCAPDGKRIQRTRDWPEFRAKEYPKLKPALQKKYPGFNWR